MTVVQEYDVKYDLTHNVTFIHAEQCKRHSNGATAGLGLAHTPPQIPSPCPRPIHLHQKDPRLVGWPILLS